jgi:hypothetical protein
MCEMIHAYDVIGLKFEYFYIGDVIGMQRLE